jgi:hypothetical protein
VVEAQSLSYAGYFARDLNSAAHTQKTLNKMSILYNPNPESNGCISCLSRMGARASLGCWALGLPLPFPFPFPCLVDPCQMFEFESESTRRAPGVSVHAAKPKGLTEPASGIVIPRIEKTSRFTAPEKKNLFCAESRIPQPRIERAHILILAIPGTGSASRWALGPGLVPLCPSFISADRDMVRTRLAPSEALRTPRQTWPCPRVIEPVSSRCPPNPARCRPTVLRFGSQYIHFSEVLSAQFHSTQFSTLQFKTRTPGLLDFTSINLPNLNRIDIHCIAFCHHFTFALHSILHASASASQLE